MQKKITFPYTRNFLTQIKAFYINASTAYAPYVSILCIISYLPIFIKNGIQKNDMICVLCVLFCSVLSLFIQTKRADNIFQNIYDPNETSSINATISMEDNYIDYTIHTETNDICHEHIFHTDIQTMFVTSKKAIILSKNNTIIPISFANIEKTDKETSLYFKKLQTKAPLDIASQTYKMLTLVMLFFTLINFTSIIS